MSSEIQPHPVFAQRLAALAERLEAAGQTEAAAEVYDIAASLTHRGEPFRQKSAALRRAGVKVMEDPERDHKKHNLEASHAVGMARVLEVRGELARAQEMFDLAKLRAPFHYLAYAGAGYLHLRRRDLRAALEEFVQARRLNPLDRKLAIEVARVALELEDYQEALRHACDALLLSQGLGDADEIAARRRVETLGALCRMSRTDLDEVHRQRAGSDAACHGTGRAHPGAALLHARPLRAQGVTPHAGLDPRRPAPGGARPAPLQGLPPLLRSAARPACPDRQAGDVPSRPGTLPRGRSTTATSS